MGWRAWIALLLLTLAGATAMAQPAPTGPLFQDALQLGPDHSRTIRLHVWPSAADSGRLVRFFVLAQLPGSGGAAYAWTEHGWQPARPGVAPLPPTGAATLASSTHSFEIARDIDIRGLYGTQLFVGYGIEGAAADSAYQDMVAGAKYRQVAQLKSAAPPGARSAQLVPSCPSDPALPRFGTLPLPLSDFIAFRPLGFQSVPVHMLPAKHSAFSMTPIGATAQPRPVRAPTRATVTEIAETLLSNGARNYQIFMHPCRDLRLYFGHIVSIAPRLQAAMSTRPPTCTTFGEGGSSITSCKREDLSVVLEEGEEFGTGPDTAGVDFGALDFRRAPAGFIYTSHYDAYYPYYVSPYELFQPDVAAQLATKTGSVLGTRLRTASPIGGSYMQDLLGSAQGNWFPPGIYWANSTDSSPFLGVAHDYTDPTRPLLAVGTSVPGMKAGLYTYAVRSSGVVNRDPADIKADGQVYCLEGFAGGTSAGDMPLSPAAGVLLLALPNEVAMWVEFRPAASCAAATPWALSANAALFVR